MRDTALEVKIENGELIIKVGIATLCNAVRQCPIIDNAVMEANGDESAVTITDETIFAKAILHILEEEAEDGSTRIHRMFDAAANDAIEDGCEGIEFRDEK